MSNDQNNKMSGSDLFWIIFLCTWFITGAISESIKFRADADVEMARTKARSEFNKLMTDLQIKQLEYHQDLFKTLSGVSVDGLEVGTPE